MRLEIHAVGRLKAGPERDLADRYLDRLAKTGPAVGLEFGGVSEHAESRAKQALLRKKDEAEKLSAQIAPSSVIVVLDENGKNFDSAAFAFRIGRLRDDGAGPLAFVIGGPDGLDEALMRSAAFSVSFGAMTWPHQMVRVLLAEQLYRAVTILTGHPYHRV